MFAKIVAKLSRRIAPRRFPVGSASHSVSAALIALGVAAILQPRAKADDFALGRRIFADKAQCPYCHGWAGDGAGEPQSSGGAANLRESKLTREQLIEVISCGIPGKAMPRFDDQAYAEKRCYGGVSEAGVGQYLPPLPPGSVLSPREIGALVDFLEARIIDRGAITREECLEALGERAARTCAQYPQAQ
jgi:mono/diheme cytochrome c family protein